MSLTTGRGPFSRNPAGRFDPPVPEGVSYVEPFLRRVRAELAGATVIDSERALLVHRAGSPPTLAFPVSDAGGLGEADPSVAGFVAVPWDAVDRWFEEDEEFLGHPRNPYHRVDCISTSRHLRVEVAGEVLVDTTGCLGVYETSLPPRLYVEAAAVRMELLRPSTTTTYCPYKGTATHWSAVVGGVEVPDVAWSYLDPLPECHRIAGLLSFYADRATVITDLPTPDLR